ncbi:MAG TPA: hypothetical protein VEK35_06020 [Roseiarcus sp.]|nr:hypothetical protein [Roseiarcus sp.]
MTLVRRDRGLLLAVAAALIGVSALGLSAARAGDDGEAPLWQGIGGMLGLVGTDKVDEPIAYEERGRLVLPPTMDLPPPASAAQKTADWPQDPDALRVQAQREKILHRELRGPTWDKAHLHGRPLRPDELASDSTLPNHGSSDPCQRDPRNCHWIGATVLEKLGVKKSEDTIVAGQEPDREWLTDPPKGYRMPVANTNATFDVKPAIDQGDARSTLYVAPSQ